MASNHLACDSSQTTGKDGGDLRDQSKIGRSIPGSKCRKSFSFKRMKKKSRLLRGVIRKCADCYFEPEDVESCYPKICVGDTYSLVLFLCQNYHYWKKENSSGDVRAWMKNELKLGE